MAAAVTVPEALRLRYVRTRQGREWLDGLPELVETALVDFGMVTDPGAASQSWHGHGALVVPVRSAAGGTPAVLKFPYPHPESATEAAALQLWNGTGAVRLLAQDPAGTALLLERLDPGTTLAGVPVQQAAEVWGGLIRMLSLPSGDDPLWAAVPSVAEHAEQLSDQLPADWEALGRPFERWLLEEALQVCQTRGVVGRRWNRDVLVHADLHCENVLHRLAPHSGWAAIDPQAVLGEPEYAVAPMLWNRLQDLDPEAPEQSLQDRLRLLCDAGGLDPDAAREWSILREVVNAVDYVGEGQHGDAQRSVWVASALAGRSHPGLPPVWDLPAA